MKIPVYISYPTYIPIWLHGSDLYVCLEDYVEMMEETMEELYNNIHSYDWNQDLYKEML